MPKFYHATHRRNVPAIMEAGLSHEQQPQYPETRPGYVYLFDDPKRALYWGHSKYGQNRAVFEVDLPDAPEADPTMPGAYMYSGQIAPQQISKLPYDPQGWLERRAADEDDVWNITNGDEVIQGKPLDPDDEDPHLFQYVPPKRDYSMDEALTDLRSGGYDWQIQQGDEPQMWRLQHKREPFWHDVSSRDLQLKGYQVWYGDGHLPRAKPHSFTPSGYFLHDPMSGKPTERFWPTQRVDDVENWVQPEPGALNEPYTKEHYPDLWQKHWGSKTASTDDRAPGGEFRIPFILTPGGTFVMGNVGDEHWEIQDDPRQPQELLDYYRRLDPSYTDEEVLDGEVWRDHQGQVNFDPETGEMQAHWPVNWDTMQPKDWITPEMQQRVRAEAQRRWRGRTAANPPDWKSKYNYREAKGPKSCATCSAFKDGECLMFNASAEADMTCDEWSKTWKPKTATIDSGSDTWFNKESNDDQTWQEDGAAGAEAQGAAGAPAGQVEYYWPSPEEAQELSYHAVDNHQGFRDPNGFASAVTAARYQQIYGGINDVYTLAAHLINSVQRQQALVEGNKRTGTLLGLWFLEENGIDTEGIPPEEFGDLVVAMSEKAVTPEQVGDYLRKWLGQRTAMALSPDLLQQHIDKHGPHFYHRTHIKNVPSILRNGILPINELPPDADYYPWTPAAEPMSGATYLRHIPRTHKDFRNQLVSVADHGSDEPKYVNFAVDATKLDPKRFLMDEDNVHERLNDPVRDRVAEGEGIGDVTRELYPDKIESVDPWWSEMQGDNRDAYPFTIAYDGAIPPEALSGLYHQGQWYDPEDYLWDFHPEEVPDEFMRVAKFVLKGDWNDVMAKAKRLIQEGKVTILHNTPAHVMAQVMGDGSDNDGEPDMHEVEFSREDPNSNVITQSVCDCAYNQYRWDRTRPWKKFEGRPCSHILAAYWKSKATPQDIEDAAPGYQVPVGQRGPAAPQGQMKIPGAEPGVTKKDLGFGEGAFGPEGQEGAAVPPPVPSKQQIGIPGQPQNPFSPPKATPSAPTKNPTPQREQMQLFNLSPEPSTTPPNPAVSVPGATPPTPENPVQLPGTFSKVAGDISRMGDELVGNLSFLVTNGEIVMGEPGYHHPDVWYDHTGEQVFNPEEGEFVGMGVDHPYYKAGQGNVGFSIKDGQITDLQVSYDYLDSTLNPEIEQKAADTIYAWMAKTGIEDASQVPEDWTTQFDLPGEMPKLTKHASVDDEMLQHFLEQQANGDPIYVATTKPQTLEFRGGKQPIPGAQPYDVSTEGVPLYKILELGYNPETGQRENADVNAISGAPEWRGQYGDVPTNRRGEVRDFDPHVGWAYVHVPLHYPGGEDARLHPHSLAGWVPMNELRVVHPPRTPFRRR